MMKAVRFFVTLIAVLSVAGCFGFAVFAAPPETEWDGISPLKNNRSYIVSYNTRMNGDITVPSDTVLTLKRGSKLEIADGARLKIDGGVNMQEGSSLSSNGTINVSGTGTLSVGGKINADSDAIAEISGMLDIQPQGEVRLLSQNIFTSSCIITSSGKLFLDKDSATIQSGKMYIENGGLLTVAGKYDITESGLLDSSGEVKVERLGVVSAGGHVNLREGSMYTDAGTVSEDDEGNIDDDAEHGEIPLYAAELFAKEDEVILRGIDVSWVQGDIDWAKVKKSGIDFAIIRAGRGDIDETGPKEDTFFRQNIEGAIKNGVNVGVYFYSYAQTVEQAVEEAKFYIDLLEGYEITYPVIMDVEENIEGGNSKLSEIADAFLQVVSQDGYYPMLYSFRLKLEKYIDTKMKDHYAIWVAQTENDQPPDVDFEYYMWQYSHEGHVNGIEGNVDLNVAYRDFPVVLKFYGLNKLK